MLVSRVEWLSHNWNVWAFNMVFTVPITPREKSKKLNFWAEYLEKHKHNREENVPITCHFFNFFSLALNSIKWFSNWKYLHTILKSWSFVLPFCETVLYILFQVIPSLGHIELKVVLRFLSLFLSVLYKTDL